jgi:hypothetical protein
LPATLVFDQPSPAAIADRIAAALATADHAEPSAGDLLADLDRIAAGLDRLSTQDDGRRLVAKRLNRILAALDTEPATTDDVTARLDSASADDVLAFIDQEFGRRPV